jgi:hypothetical protein
MAYSAFLRQNFALKLLVSLWLLILFSISVEAQIRNTTDGLTPPGLAPGAPAGAYPLSEFENINLYNGQVSFTMPVTQKGRGEPISAFLSGLLPTPGASILRVLIIPALRLGGCSSMCIAQD